MMLRTCLIFLSRHFELIIFSNLVQRYKFAIHRYFGNFRIYIIKVFRVIFINTIVPLSLDIAGEEELGIVYKRCIIINRNVGYYLASASSSKARLLPTTSNPVSSSSLGRIRSTSDPTGSVFAASSLRES
jgi:hypothetical protein